LGNTGLTHGKNKILRLPYETKELSEKRKAERGDIPCRSIPQLLLQSQEQQQQFHCFITGQHLTTNGMV
jgi:hypothetical protein